MCDAIWQVLQPTEMAKPTVQNWVDISKGFFEKTQFPNCAGAVDGKHVRVECPKNSGTLYYNYKQFYSLILMAICDSNYCFRIIDVGSYGKESDCNIFNQLVFGKKLYANKINFPSDHNLPGDEYGSPQLYVIVGDEAFGLHKNVLRPFPGRSFNDERRIFNYRLSKARQMIECAFGILSKKLRIFQTSILVEPNVAIRIIKACCILYNFVWRRDGFNYEDTLSCSMESLTERTGVGYSTNNAKDVREYFVGYVNDPNHALAWKNKVIN